MENISSYLEGKLFDINYRMATHEGNANRRLASEAAKIRLLAETEVPKHYRKEFRKLLRLIENTFRQLPASGLTPTSIRNIYNVTAAKYIKMLLDMQYYIQEVKQCGK